jgi:hypothetical protein
LGAAAQTAVNLTHLLDDVGGRQTGQGGVLWLPLAVWQVTECAREEIWLTSGGDDRRQGWMAIGMPVSCAEEVNLLGYERRGAIVVAGFAALVARAMSMAAGARRWLSPAAC